VIAHESCHVRRRDNLAVAVHMFVESLFWFHPLVWWIKVRLIDEQERACDEEVLLSGGDAKVYAESILKICRFYLASPLASMSGITGSDLKKRIENIMKCHIGLRLSFTRTALLAIAAGAALVGPIAVGVVHARAGQAQFQRTGPSQADPVASEQEPAA